MVTTLSKPKSANDFNRSAPAAATSSVHVTWTAPTLWPLAVAIACAPRAAAVCCDGSGIVPSAVDWTSKASWSRVKVSGPCRSRITQPRLVDVIDRPSTVCTSGPTLVAKPTSPPRVKRTPEASIVCYVLHGTPCGEEAQHRCLCAYRRADLGCYRMQRPAILTVT